LASKGDGIRYFDGPPKRRGALLDLTTGRTVNGSVSRVDKPFPEWFVDVHPIRLLEERTPTSRTRVSKNTDPAIHGIEINPNFSM